MDFSNINAPFSVTIRRGLYILICTLTLALPSITLSADNILLDQLTLLDSEFREFSSTFYRQTSSKSDKTLPKVNNINDLLQLVNESVKDSDDVTAIRLLHRNGTLVMNNVDNRAVFTFIELLLKNNERNMADRIFAAIKQDGDKSLLATSNFIFAKYYAIRNEWVRTGQLLEGTFTELAATDATYAYLLKGVALQELKKHREAIRYYKKVASDSPYYREAQLNIAIASIRQGWWTDANNIIKKVTGDTVPTGHDEILNRLQLVLGYALLQREYYRNARDEFRKISLKSRYTNRALLGIGLTATNQGDYIGGLNALSILKQKKTFDLSVDESYLLLPYVYDKLQQEITVSASYTEAMNYYQNRIKSIENLIGTHKTFLPENYDRETSTLTINDNRLDYGSIYPSSFIENYRLLLRLADRTISGNESKQIQNLLTKYDNSYQRIINTLLEQRLSYLNSYLNQSRYGFARFLDSNSETANNE